MTERELDNTTRCYEELVLCLKDGEITRTAIDTPLNLQYDTDSSSGQLPRWRWWQMSVEEEQRRFSREALGMDEDNRRRKPTEKERMDSHRTEWVYNPSENIYWLYPTDEEQISEESTVEEEQEAEEQRKERQPSENLTQLSRTMIEVLSDEDVTVNGRDDRSKKSRCDRGMKERYGWRRRYKRKV